MPQAHTYLTSEHASIDELLAPVPGWLGRPLTPDDGLPAAQVDAAVARLAAEGFVVPPLLRDLQLRIGNCAPLMRHFQRFEAPEDWALAVADEDEEGEEGEEGAETDEGGDEALADDPPVMFFLDENQSVCQWLTDATGQVYMLVNGELHAEQLALPQFLAVILPYQLAQGGFPCSADAVLPKADLEDERAAILDELGWPLLAQHNGLTIHGAGSAMLWSLDAMPGEDEVHLFFSCLNQNELDELCERFDFVDLG